MFGALRGVAYVTVLHSAVKIVGVGLILGVALYGTGGVHSMVASLPADYFTWNGKIGAPTIIAWTVGTIGAIFSTQFIIQAISSNKSADDARRSTIYAAALCLPPVFSSNRGATHGLLGAAVATTVSYALGNPYGMDNTYIAAATPIA